MVPVNKKGSCSKKTKLDVRSMGSLLGKNPAMVFAKSVLPVPEGAERIRASPLFRVIKFELKFFLSIRGVAA
ncbi:hypothetical protein R84B8_01479 [Treponema sp. R8-4-B8]